jgi:hypothetical protein
VERWICWRFVSASAFLSTELSSSSSGTGSFERVRSDGKSATGSAFGWKACSGAELDGSRTSEESDDSTLPGGRSPSSSSLSMCSTAVTGSAALEDTSGTVSRTEQCSSAEIGLAPDRLKMREPPELPAKGRPNSGSSKRPRGFVQSPQHHEI